MVKVAIIEENKERQLELKNFLNVQRELTCIFAGSSVKEFQQIISTGMNLQVVIIGIQEDTLFKLTPFQLRNIKQAHPGLEILILADSTDTKKVIAWLRAGVVGYLPWHTPLDEIKEAVIGIQQGEAPIVPYMVRQMLEFFQRQVDFEGVLTEREIEIVQGLVEGLSYKLIACKLNIVLDTVRFHLRNIYKKLKVNSKSQVISKAVSMEWKD